MDHPGERRAVLKNEKKRGINRGNGKGIAGAGLCEVLTRFRNIQSRYAETEEKKGADCGPKRKWSCAVILKRSNAGWKNNFE